MSYFNGEGAGVKITKDLDIARQHILMVEDVVDTGMTLNYLLNYLRTRNPASVKVCSLLDKRVRRLVDVPLDYVGFEIPDEFVVWLRSGLSGETPQPALYRCPRARRERESADPARVTQDAPVISAPGLRLHSPQPFRLGPWQQPVGDDRLPGSLPTSLLQLQPPSALDLSLDY